MTTDDKALVPVWTLATEAVNVPDVIGDEAMTPARLADQRTALANLSDSPIAMWAGVTAGTQVADAAIEIERSSDGSFVVFPAIAA